jgi:hypothetical protein
MAGVSIADVRAWNRAGKIVPFVGAGLSLPLGLPSWDGVLEAIAEELEWDPEEFKRQGDHLQLAQYYVLQKGSVGPLRSKLDRAWNPSDEAIRSSPTHRALTALGVPMIYTTNYDTILERAFALHGVAAYSVTTIDDIATAPPGVPRIVKFHGSFHDDESLVLTESSYFERLDFNTVLDIKLRSDALGKCLLFLGYGLRDINIRLMLHNLHKLRLKERVRVAGGGIPSAVLTVFGSGEVQAAILEEWDVKVLELDDTDPTASMAAFLEEIA